MARSIVEHKERMDSYESPAQRKTREEYEEAMSSGGPAPPRHFANSGSDLQQIRLDTAFGAGGRALSLSSMGCRFWKNDTASGDR